MIGTRPGPRLLAPVAGRIWLAAALIYLLLHLLPVSGPVAWYVPDLLCLPVVLGAVLMAQRLAGRPPAWRLPWWHGMLIAILYGLWFEVIAPRWLGRGTADPLDGAAYLVGWLLFQIFVNR